jgi:hypothetical protein
VDNRLTTRDNIEAVEAWIEKKRNENDDLMAIYQVDNDMNHLANRQANCELICLAQFWLVETRLKLLHQSHP